MPGKYREISASIFSPPILLPPHPHTQGLREVFSEVEILSLLRHPSIVRLEEIYEDSSNLWLVMDLIEGGELEQELRKQGRFKEEVARKIIRHILLALEYIHEKGIVHRDLKLANMLMSGRFEEGGNCEVKLADFGFSCVVSNESTLTSFCGTTVFMAPEILQDHPYGKPVDMWAVGVITFLLLFGCLPFSSSNEGDLLRLICEAEFSFKDDSTSKECRDFISKLLVTDVLHRLTATEALHHSWVKGIDTAGGYMDYEEASSEAEEDIDAGSLAAARKNKAKKRIRKVYWVIIAAHRMIYTRRLSRLEQETSIPALIDFQYLVSGKFEKHAALSIAGVPICSQAVGRICEILESSKRLESLTMSCVSLSYDALQMVVKSVAASRITSLDLSGNPISSAGARALLRLARGSRLRHLNLKNTGISQDIMGQVDGALKDAKGKRGGTTDRAERSERTPVSGVSSRSSGTARGSGQMKNSNLNSRGPQSSSLPALPKLGAPGTYGAGAGGGSVGTGMGGAGPSRRCTPTANTGRQNAPTPRKGNLEAIR